MPAKAKTQRVRPATEGEEGVSEDTLSENLGRKVKALRSERGWSLEQLAAASGVSRSMLSEIEREKANPTLTVTFRIAKAFDLSLQELIESAETPVARIRVIRASDKGQVYRADKECSIRTLSPLNLEKDVEFYELTLRPNGALRSQPHFERTREFLTVEEGTVRVESAGETSDLIKGDSATYAADVPHAIINTSEQDAVVFLVVIYR